MSQDLRDDTRKKSQKCDACSSEFNTNYVLNQHKNHAHSDRKAFTCNSYEKAFKSKGALKTQ